MPTFGENIEIENVCVECPLRKILDCNTAKLIGSATGLNIRTGGYVLYRYKDDSENYAEVKVSTSEQTIRRQGLVGAESNSEIDISVTSHVAANIEECQHPKRKGIQILGHCATGIEFRRLKQSERDAWENAMHALRSGAGSARGGLAPRTRFKTS